LSEISRAKGWSVNLADIREVGVEPRRYSLAERSAGRNRLKLVLANGEVDIFVVNRLKSLITRLNNAIGTAGTPNVQPPL
jgi:hypothetical protein